MKDAKNIITKIKEDHVPLKAGIRILKNENAHASEKKAALKKFLTDLRLHAKAEEKALYDNVVDNKEVRDPVLEGYEEHAIADMLSDELMAADFESNWTDEIGAKAKVLAELVEHHVLEEEEEMLPDLKEAFSSEELVNLGEKYVQAYQMLEAQLVPHVIPKAGQTISKSAH